VKQQPDDSAVLQQRDVSEQQALAQVSAHHRYVHWIPHMTIQSGDHQMAGWEDGRRGAEPLKSESEKAFQKANDPQRGERAPGKTEKRQPEKWSFDAPMGDQPGHYAGDESGGDDQEGRGTKERPDLSHYALM
jgi:hypothetical protein